MSRLEDVCCGDCSKCELVKFGSVDMVPCVLDQIFQRLQRLEKSLQKSLVFSSIEQVNIQEDELQRNAGKSQNKRCNNGKNDVE